MRTCPIEDVEEEMLSDYCKLLGLNHWHVPNETYTPSFAQKRKNEALGVQSGVSDHWIRIKNGTGEKLIVIEMKRQFGNTPTDKQIAFIEDMNKLDDVYACCCYGGEEAIKVLDEMRQDVYNTYYDCLMRMQKLKEKRQKTTEKPKNVQKKNKKVEKNDLPY